jgi:hypothetical protein
LEQLELIWANLIEPAGNQASWGSMLAKADQAFQELTTAVCRLTLWVTLSCESSHWN